MEVHSSSVVTKRLWNVLRITFFMIRKGFVSKRKMMMDMNLMMKKGKLLRKSLANFMSFHHHHHHKNMMARVVTHDHYEFSCNNSPNPVPKRNKHHFNFLCIHAPNVLEDHDFEEGNSNHNINAVVLIPKTPEYAFNFRLDNINGSDFAPGERKSPLLSSSPLISTVRISNYSALDYDENEEIGNGSGGVIDDEAEDFIRRFYEQLRSQSRMQLLHYQDNNV
ncbi:hypothetical protein HN51_041268 [Arachis hypogaea]|uniref:uncharacterized protein LOC107624652 n=1 Tax=Arachis ipaensis TaxID=130454 RepID=UPI0007AF10B2|nr:uncharacterized protein LOC107624652 [Arachis ipaensis]XP_025658559.1 uncharacterized protein LOC112754943 [Arachis hypogaea]QHN86991.1 uncharacterized protein DS421_16g551100 [Arachis hypogaea]